MTGHIAIIGNSPLNIGSIMAADLTLAGEEARLFLWPDQQDLAEAAKAAGGLTVLEPSDQTKSGQTGLATPRIVTGSPAEAVKGAALVVLDVTGDDVERRFRDLVPHLEEGQVVHINTHGYWPSLRVAGLLRDAGKTGVILTEGVTPSIAAGRDGATITPHTLRRNVLVAAFPSNRSDVARVQLARIFHSFDMARDVLHSNLSGMNFLIHPGIALVNIGYFDRAGARGEKVSFYGTGNTENAMRMTEALDGERPAVAATLDVPCPSVAEQVARIYGLEPKALGDLVAEVPFYRDLPPLPADVWKAWMRWDIPHAHVPFVLLAEALGHPAPLHRGLVDIMDALVGMSSWTEGVTLARLGLEDMTAQEMIRFVREG
ncbi:NAD/NADP octopine/nopaline dehydrogenase family protein [Mameliella sediminis]|uniref:NAD/NADP octopine/nopaline dehydrogenase family protein n=1 Tax=Mameliella sediminis TaxID=2836866 RepID=UPI001C45D676|nr:NAD/NADP octopine/nopaline dehydrogenase family protein [Mameliella sediminis]MBV7394092.1 NAD/NADP octopine/nopaline dehydrogenase family protein [Mameliella sediminis]